ncbi:MAG TPA: HNH endonuclease signature motif containing protein [Nitrososphaeraceae archaeon]|nr:HNH endonuclease signature motif containing protein [Nitrososphaeraceae archaeon]
MFGAIGVVILLLIALALAQTGVQAETAQDIVDKLDSISGFLFSMMLLSLFPLIYKTRRNVPKVALATFLGIGSYLLWFSHTLLWLDIGLKEQRAIASVIWIVGIAVLLSCQVKKGKRKSFSILVKKEAVQKQKTRCARCKRKLVEYGHDFDHKNGNRSNNKLSNCQALCTPCHRRKHI